MSGIFKAYDVRGKYPLEIDEEKSYKVGIAFGKFLKGKDVVIGMDVRESSPSIKNSVIRGLCEAGKNVVDIGLCNTPMLYFAVIKWGMDGGIMISASHNPSEYNGIKMVKNENNYILQIGRDSGMKEIEKLSSSVEIKEIEPDFKKKGILKEYLEDCFSKLEKKDGLKIIIDYGNGVGGISGVPFFEMTDFEVVSLFSEPMSNFPNHEPNPHVKKNFEPLIKKVLEEKADLGIFFDGDADRAIPVDENGKVLRGDVLIGLLSIDVLQRSEEKEIYYDLRCSKTLKEEIEKHKGIPVKMKVGNPYYKEKLIKEGGAFGGETSGHMMYKEHYCIDDGLYAMVNLLNIMTNSGKSLSQLSKPFMRYNKTYEINMEVNDKKSKLEELEQHYKKLGAKIEKIDGITVGFDEWWFNIRPSNTEDLLRLNLEAQTKELMEEKVKEVEKIIKG